MVHSVNNTAMLNTLQYFYYYKDTGNFFKILYWRYSYSEKAREDGSDSERLQRYGFL